MKGCINRRIIGRDTEAIGYAHGDWKPVDFSLQEWAAEINKGHAFAPLYSGQPSIKTFLQADFLPVDIDEGLSLDTAMANPFVNNYANIIYTTANHQKPKPEKAACDRFRIITRLKTPITSAEDYRAALHGLKALCFPMMDESACNAAHRFCGSTGSEPKVFEDNYLPDSELQKLIDAGKAVMKKEENQKHSPITTREDTPPVEEAERMLSFIPPMLGYHDWCRVIWGLTNTYGSDIAFELVEKWSPDYQTSGSETSKIAQKNDGQIKMGTVIHMAQQYGYQLPPDLQLKRAEIQRMPGQVALEDVFAGGMGYKTIASNLHEYIEQQGYYRPMENVELKRRVSEYFNTYQTSKNGKCGYADSITIKKAVSFVKIMCELKPNEKINPPGLNFQNGYLKLDYDKGVPVWELLPHSPEYIFTYCSLFPFSPEIGTSPCDGPLSDMLPSEAHRIIVLRTLAATLDLKTVRTKLGRGVRAVFLYGEGLNGKDTLQAWTTGLMGGHGLTNITMVAFKQADSGRLFGLPPLAHSLVNWSSENAKVLLDECQTLKAAQTGDPIKVSKKGKDEYTICPQTVFFFNINKLPALRSNQEAIKSRYCIVPFPNTFKRNPDPNKPCEKKADPRFKEDLDYVAQFVGPAFFNLIIREYAALLKEGIDYSSVDALMDNARQETEHLLICLDDQGLDFCDYKKGMTAKKFYDDFYLPWAIALGYLTLNPFGGKPIQHFEHDLDKPLTSHAGVSKRLKALSPDFTLGQDSSGQNRLIGLRSVRPPMYKPSSDSVMESML